MNLLRGLNMRVRAEKDELLGLLRHNRAEHRKMIDEARKGFVQKAREKLSTALDKLADGKSTGVSISLDAPIDHTSEYDTVIRMLELHQGDMVELSADEVRMFVEDEWDWSGRWLVANSGYSSSIADKARAAGVIE